MKLRNHAGRIVIVPLHRELARGTLAAILRQVGIDGSDFAALQWRAVLMVVRQLSMSREGQR